MKFTITASIIAGAAAFATGPMLTSATAMMSYKNDLGVLDLHQSRILSELPWDQLASQLSPSAELLDGSPEKYIEECTSLFFSQQENFTLSQYDLNEQPSGLCMNILVNGFEGCSPYDADSFDALLEEGEEILTNPAEIQRLFFDDSNPLYNLPHKVLRPHTAGDIASSVAFANEHGVEISVKNSGHHYAGASTKKDSLLIHTQTYGKKYSSESLEVCNTEGDEDTKADLSNMPCKLALARGRPAIIRVGGGENWSDAYLAVKQWNEEWKKEHDSYKYHIVGGAAGSVTPMGWTWQGGLSGTNAGRELGFGVDQVLQIEMILPDGSHVKFGPTEWEDANADGYIYPKTTKVSGVCNNNPMAEDENQWIWEPCTNGVNFDDLWFAVRGGGGGTWGIVLSTYLQLHEYPGIHQHVIFDYSFSQAKDACNETEAKCEEYRSELATLLANFYMDFYFDPAALQNVTEEQSNLCGSPGAGGGIFFCYGGAGDALLSAWEHRILEHQAVLAGKGIPEKMIDIAAGSGTVLAEFDDYAAAVTSAFPEGHRHEGKAFDSPPPSLINYVSSATNALVPKTLLLSKRDYWIPFLRSALAEYDNPYIAHAEKTDDQASSLSDAHRGGGFMIFMDHNGETAETVFKMLFGEMDNDADFPGFLGSNHLGPFTMGPLKNNWTKPCPTEWMWEKRAEECISPQEAVWGTKKLRRLEQIKADIDPKNLFNCFTCVSGSPTSPDETPEAAETEDPVGLPINETRSTEPASSVASFVWLGYSQLILAASTLAFAF